MELALLMLTVNLLVSSASLLKVGADTPAPHIRTALQRILNATT